MKKEFLEPEVTVLHIENTDIICASIPGCGSMGNETTYEEF